MEREGPMNTQNNNFESWLTKGFSEGQLPAAVSMLPTCVGYPAGARRLLYALPLLHEYFPGFGVHMPS